MNASRSAGGVGKANGFAVGATRLGGMADGAGAGNGVVGGVGANTAPGRAAGAGTAADASPATGGWTGTAADVSPASNAWPGMAADASTASNAWSADASPTLADLAFALLADDGDDGGDGSAEAAWLDDCARRVAAAPGVVARPADTASEDPPTPAERLAHWHAAPPPSDRRLRDLARRLPLIDAETLAVALVCAAETDAFAARVLSWLQAPVGGGRPTAGLVARLASAFGDAAGLAALATGLGRESGLLKIADDTRPLPEATLTVPQPIVFALADPPRLHWPGLYAMGTAASADDEAPIPLPPSLLAAAAAHARALRGRDGGTASGASGASPTSGAFRASGVAAGAGASGTSGMSGGAEIGDGRHARGVSDTSGVSGVSGAGPADGGRPCALLVRAGHPREGRAAAAAVAQALGARPVFAESDVPPGFGPWLRLAGAVPVLVVELVPGERRRIAEIAGWRGPVLVVAGPDGSIEFRGETAAAWRVPIPPAAERQALWRLALAADGDLPTNVASDPGDVSSRLLADLAGLADRLGLDHRHAAGRIAELGRAARFEARLDGGEGGAGATAPEAPSAAHVARAARGGAAGDAGALAELMDGEIPDDALVLPPALRAELEALASRCLARDGAADGLGPALRARFRPGVRALFVGPSGTGKSLAVGWLATRLGLPLYRVDLASVSSKYIGETEKNLAQLFARAEHAEVVLMFDEADALFGKRTDVKDSNDRFANAQTNYLLTRIESYEGIAVLTSNSRARFDSAFTRRLDAILEFPAPLPQERRALWEAHLGAGSALAPVELNRLAVGCELAGGHIRNIVLAAAAVARREGRAVGYGDLVRGVEAECRKLGRQVPHGLVDAGR